MRPGRLDKIIYVGLPTVQDRLEILKTLTKVKKKNLINLFVLPFIFIYFKLIAFE